MSWAGFVLVVAGCAAEHDYSYTSHSGARRRMDDARFTLNWAHTAKSKVETEHLSLEILYGPLGKSMDIDGKKVEARFEHEEGGDYYDPPPGAKVRTFCDQEHEVQGSIVILSHEPSGIRAALRVKAACPVKGNFDIEGEHTFESVSVFYR
jgi:hypothetical protein